MVNLSISKKVSPAHTQFIGDCVDALFDSYKGEYDIFVDSSKFVDSNGAHAGFCFGDDMESVIDIATHFYYEDGEESRYTPAEIAGTLAHELVHAKQFAYGQINMVDHVWRKGTETLDCTELSYDDTPWEKEAYTLESMLVELFWRDR